MEAAIIALMLAHAPLTALVGGRIKPVVRGQGQPLPAVVFNRITGARDMTMAGPSGTAESLVQIDCYGETYAATKAVANAVRGVLSGYRGTVGGVEVLGVFLESERDSFDADATAKIYRVSMDFTVWAVEA